MPEAPSQGTIVGYNHFINLALILWNYFSLNWLLLNLQEYNKVENVNQIILGFIGTTKENIVFNLTFAFTK